MLASTALPVVYLLAFGTAFGTLVPGTQAGLSYSAYVGSGLLVFFAVQVGAVETGMPLFSDLNWNRHLHAVRYTPATPATILGGYLLFLAVRCAQVSVLVLLVLQFQHALPDARAVAAVVVAIGCMVAVSGVVAMCAVAARTSFQIESVQRVLPVAVLVTSGVLFPTGRLPGALQPAVAVNPCYHGVQLSRALFGASGTGPVAVHVLVLAAWALGGYLLAAAYLQRRLRKG